jgi:S-adenosylmethionine:tRNA ribosyltransferase-isomerase
MKLSEFHYELPKELIAQYPTLERDSCRLMVLDRKRSSVEHKSFKSIEHYFKKGDCLVLNDTRVMPARMFGKRKTGGKVEIFLLEKKDPICEALLRPSGRLKEGEIIELDSGDEVEVLSRGEAGRFIKFNSPLDDVLSRAGHIPLPPYMSRPDSPGDAANYQTVYASKEGATASPTAGLHFTEELLDHIKSMGVSIAMVTLHTNYGTFAPIKCEDIEDHKMHKEYFEISSRAMDAVRKAKNSGNKVFAVGTTSNRVLEHCAPEILSSSKSRTVSGWTDLFIYPGYNFKVTDHLLTNFHLPESTLLVLLSAFAGKEYVSEAYKRAIEERYRFFSYGDAMLVL